MSLPPGSGLPAAIQTLYWVARPISFMERHMRRYGNCFTGRFLIGNVVFIADPDAIKAIFTGDPELLHAGEANTLEPFVGEHSILLLDGAAHLRQRRLMLPSFHGERMERYGDLIAEITERDIESWPVGQPFPLRTRMQAITLEVIMRAVFGMEEGERLDRLRTLLSDMIEFGMGRWRWVALMLPQLRRDFGPWRPWTAFQRATANVDAVLYDEIRRRRSDPTTPERDDILSLLLQARDEDGNPMTNRELRDELMTLLLAGHETTATALAWSFDLLLRHPHALARLEAEIEQDGDSDTYLDAVIKETLRLRPVLPGVLRKLTAPMELKGYTLPAGTRVAPSIYLTHRLPDIYPDPSAFRPERFFEHPADTYAWIPFGGGIRRCLGASFATFEMKVVLPTTLQQIRLKPVGESPEPIRRRAITFAPGRNALAVVEEFKEPRTREAGEAAPAAARG